ncbi:MAG: hypothetical protein M1821_007216 [Bathelium mastoideum]|nr:MAG: hypothetical protein M1821_007216 [Bathelium mastoideum]
MSNQEDLTPHKPSPTASDVSDHIGSFKEFFSHLNQAAKSALPTIPQRYNDVSVLLLRWEDDNLGTQTELNDLRDIFQGVYRYNVEQYLIPSNDPTLHLEDRLNDFRRAYGAEGNLLILYYGGHGSSEKNTRRSIWSPRETGNVSLVWSDLQGVLTRSNADVVFILDCCYAASASRGDRPSANEGLWASNSVATTTGVNDNSFTRNLIAELKLASADRLNVVMLHARLMRRFPKQLQTEPFYTYLGDNTLPSVEFSPIRAFEKGIKGK